MIVGDFGIQPSEFWNMSPDEAHHLYDMKRPRDPENDYAGKLTQEDVERLYNLLD